MKKVFVPIFACMVHVTAIAVEKNIMLPPVVAPEKFGHAIVKPTGNLVLKDAIMLTLEHNPELASYAWSIRLREIERIQASLLPNPQLNVEVENFIGSGDFNSVQSTESTIALGQLVELGDKRIKRQKMAFSNHNLARWDYEIKRIDLLTETAKAFITVLSQQEIQIITNEIYILANDVYQSIQKRVTAGKASILEEMKAQVEVSKARLATINSRRQLSFSKQTLVTLWGDNEITFSSAIGDIYAISTPPDLNHIVDKINKNPDIARWITVITREHDSIALARANTIPDITISAGLRHLNSSDDIAAVANISIPLFLFDNKKNGLRLSETKLNQSLKDKEASELKIRSSLVKNYQQLMILYDEVNILRDEVLPVSESAFNSAKKIYQLGKLDLLGLLDTQRTYFDVRRQYIQTLTDYQLMVVNIERLIGGGMESFQ